MEIVSGIWLAQSKQLDNTEWCKSKRIQCVLNFQKHFETQMPIELNYVYIDKVDMFCKKATEKLYQAHYLENKNCIVSCENGRRIGLLVLVYYISQVSGVSKKRAYDIIRTKLPIFQLDSALQRFIADQ